MIAARLTMRPAVYSRFQQLADIKRAIREAPRQEAGSKDAFAGKVFDLCEKHGGAVGTLSEVHEHLGESKVCIVAQDGVVTVLRLPDGTWVEALL
jgi:hypothetical protein